MPITYTIRPDLKTIIITHTGVIPDDEFLQAYADLYNNEAFDISFNRLIDIRKADSSPRSSDALSKLASSSEQRHEGVQSRPKTAVITSSDLSFGMARMYNALSSNASRDFTVFKSLEEGLSWLGLPADILSGQTEK